MLLALLGLAGFTSAVLAGTVMLLVVTGGAAGALQAIAAHQVMSSSSADDGSAHGVHNMLRFAGIACGYAWVSFAYPAGQSTLTFAGAGVVAGATVLVVVAPRRRAAAHHRERAVA